MKETEVYLNLREITEVHHKKVRLQDVAELWCPDPEVEARLKDIMVKHVEGDGNRRYVESVLDVLPLIRREAPGAQVTTVGNAEYIIDYHTPEKPARAWEWLKTAFVCSVCFFGAAFAIMTFNNDVDVTGVFGEIHYMITGRESDGFTVLELSYSVGLAVGITVFFNHFSRWKINTDPTPLEVEMRLYEDNISKTVIMNEGRKEQETDVS